MDRFDDRERKALDSLYSAILTMKTPEEMHSFFKDLCSHNELCSMLHRWQILLLINEGKSYEDIIDALAPDDSSESNSSGSRSNTRVSSTTISRVKACYNNVDGGYRTALARLKERENN